MAHCSSCGRQIRWVVVAKSGKKMPIDMQPASDGNLIALGTSDSASGLPFVMYASPSEDVLRNRYKSHFATCPHAAAHRTAKV